MSTGNSLSWLVLFSLISIRYVRTWPYCTAFILDNGCRLSSSHAPPVNCPLRMATSSKKLENKQSVRSTKDPKYKGISNNVVSRLAKASREATMSRRKKGTPASTTTMETALQGGENYFQNEDTIRSLSSIANLNNVIDEELLHPTDGYRPSRVLTDSMRLLLEHNCHYDEHSRQESLAKSSSKKCMKNNGMRINQIDVAIVFARPPIEGKISIEYAFRLLSLVKAVKFDGYKPNLICFFGSSTYIPLDPKEVSVTSSGVKFFENLCMFNDISLSGISLCEIPLLSNTDITPVPKYEDDDSYQTLSDQHVSSHVTSSWSPSLTPIAKELVDQHYIEKWLDESDAYESEMDEYGMTRQEPRKKIHIHLKLFSTEYHLCNLNDIDYRSPRQSPLTRLVHDLEHSASSKHHRRGIIQTSWSFYHTNYPYVMSSDKKKMKEAFLGKCYLMAQSLVPLLVNLRGVANNSEFFQRDNYSTLVATRRSLATLLEQMNVAYQHNRERQTTSMIIPPTLKVQLKKQTTRSSTTRSSTEIHLEYALLSLGRCCDLVRPAGTFSSQSVSRQEWKDALAHLKDFMNRIDCSCDPDRLLPDDKWDIKLTKNEYSCDYANILSL